MIRDGSRLFIKAQLLKCPNKLHHGNKKLWDSSLRQNEEATASDIHISFFPLKLRDSCPGTKKTDRVPTLFWRRIFCYGLHSGSPNIQTSSSHHNQRVLTQGHKLCACRMGVDEATNSVVSVIRLTQHFNSVSVCSCGTKAGMLLYWTHEHMTTAVGKLHS